MKVWKQVLVVCTDVMYQTFLINPFQDILSLKMLTLFSPLENFLSETLHINSTEVKTEP
jgi:hypothetical protein